MRSTGSSFGSPLALAFAAAIALLAASLPPPARGAELIPSIGITRTVHGGNDASVFSGLALRGPLAPALVGEIAVGYHDDSRYGDQLHVRSWPVTASLYVSPMPVVYAGAGVGWYHTTLDYASNLPALVDETTQRFGVHVGGGMELPLGGVTALDLNGRYVMLQPQESRLVPETFDPDYWTTSLGLAFHF